MTAGFYLVMGKTTILSELRKTTLSTFPHPLPSAPPPYSSLNLLFISQKVKFSKLNMSIEEASRKNNNIYELLRPLPNWKKLLLQFRSTFL